MFNNTLTEPNSCLIIVIPTPLQLVESITGFTDDVSGVDLNNYFEKEFAYSIDGLKYDDFIPLNNENLVKLSNNLKKKDIITFKFKYTKKGSGQNTITFDNIQLNITSFDIPEVSNTFKNSNLATFFSSFHDEKFLCLKLNFLDKIWNSAVLPAYIIKNNSQGVNNLEIIRNNEAFVDYWKSVSHYWAMIVTYCEEFENYSDHVILQEKYLRQHGLYC